MRRNPFYKLRRFSGDRFTGSVVTLLSGTVVAMMISYLAQPLLTRLYSPESFGLFDTFASLLSVLIPLSSLRYEDAIMLPEKDEDAKSILGLSMALVGLVSILSLGLGALEPLLNEWFGERALFEWFYWIPPGLLVLRAAKLGELWLTRQKMYPVVASGQVAQSAVAVSLRIALERLWVLGTPFGLIAGYLAGLLTAASWYAWKGMFHAASFLKEALDPTGMRAVARRYIRFPLFSMPSTLLNTLLARLPILLLLFFFDESTVGYFGRAFALFAVPLSLIGGAVSQVFFVEGAEANRTGSLEPLTLEVLNRLLTLGLFPTLGIMMTGPEVFGFVLGEAWEPAGAYLQWIAPWLFLASVASPLTRIFDLLEAQSLDLISSLVMFVLQTTLLVAGGMTGDIHQCLLALCIGGSAARIIHLAVLLRLARVLYRQALGLLLRQGVFAILPLGLLYLTQWAGRPWLTTLTLVLCCTVYGSVFLLQNHPRQRPMPPTG